MAWSNAPGPRRALPDNWPELRARAKKLAKGRCQASLPSGKRCPRAGKDADHIAGRDDHSQANIQWLCDYHHKLKTQEEARAARTKGGSVLRDPGKHPGALR